MLEWLILLFAIPAGYLIARLASDELKAGRKWFGALMIFSVIAGAWFYFSGEKVESFTSGFVFIASLISFVKSGKRKNRIE